MGEALGTLRFGNLSDAQDILDHAATHRVNPEFKDKDDTADDRVRQMCTHFIDDVAICGMYAGLKEALQDMDIVFSRLAEAGFGMRLDKGEFLKSAVVFLGWEVSKGSRRADPKKVESIAKLPDEFKDKGKIQSFLGMVGFYKDTIPVAADCERPLRELCKKGGFKNPTDWTPVHTACVKIMKQQLQGMLLLSVARIGPDEHGKEPPPLKIMVDASEYAAGVVMYQELEDGVERPCKK